MRYWIRKQPSDAPFDIEGGDDQIAAGLAAGMFEAHWGIKRHGEPDSAWRSIKDFIAAPAAIIVASPAQTEASPTALPPPLLSSTPVKCPYCGKIYPPGTPACPVDGTSFAPDHQGANYGPASLGGPLAIAVVLGLIRFLFSPDISGAVMLFSMVATVLVAYKLGFDPYYWIFAAGILGLLVLISIPAAHLTNLTETELVKRRKRANTVGGIISVAAILLGAVMFVLLAAMKPR